MSLTSDQGSPTQPPAGYGGLRRERSGFCDGYDKSLTERLLDEYKHLPQYVVTTYFRHIPAHVDRDDMVQDASLALIDWLVAMGGREKPEREAIAEMRRAVYKGLRRLDSRDLYIPDGYEWSRYGDPYVSEAVADVQASINLEVLDEDDERWAIRLHYLEGMKRKEVAEAMGVSKNKVKWIIQRSLDKLRR